jgi:transcriptional regulator with XRE-family HTH domain
VQDAPDGAVDGRIGVRIRELRIGREPRLTQRELAERAGVSVELISKLEQGSKQTALLATLGKIAGALDVDLSVLVAEPFGARLRRLRDRRGMTREVLGGLVGRSLYWVRAVERSHIQMPRLPMLLRLAEVLGVEDLAELTGDQSAVPLASLTRRGQDARAVLPVRRPVVAGPDVEQVCCCGSSVRGRSPAGRRWLRIWVAGRVLAACSARCAAATVDGLVVAGVLAPEPASGLALAGSG